MWVFLHPCSGSRLQLMTAVLLEELEWVRVSEHVQRLKTEICAILAALESVNHLSHLLGQFTTLLLTQATL